MKDEKFSCIYKSNKLFLESGLGTFRDSGGLWEKYKIEDVATPEAFKSNPKLVLDFYNIRRRQPLKTNPNPIHYSLNKLQEKYNLSIITQNIDDLHESSFGRECFTSSWKVKRKVKAF